MPFAIMLLMCYYCVIMVAMCHSACYPRAILALLCYYCGIIVLLWWRCVIFVLTACNCRFIMLLLCYYGGIMGRRVIFVLIAC